MALSLIPFVQQRWNTVNFFMRRTAPTLWKTVTSVSKAGEKKGRRVTRQPVRNLRLFYRIGAGPIKVSLPGLNAPLEKPSAEDPIAIPAEVVDEGEEGRKKSLDKVKDVLASFGKKNRHFREKLHPLERGFSGTYLTGQKLGPPPPQGDISYEGFQTYCLELKRTTQMTGTFGRVSSMEALVVTGNGQGLAGYSIAKAPMMRTAHAVAKAMQTAAKKLFFVELLEGRTIYQDFYAECNNTRIFAFRRPRGFGLLCHPRLIKICEVIGIKDLYAKVEGSTTNYRALTHAFVTGLLNQETHQQLAERKGLHVVEMSPNRHYFPQIVASPLTAQLKSEDEILPIDRLRLDDFYGEGRYALKKTKPVPFYAKLEGHLYAEWKRHPYRNMEEVKARLLADGVVPRWTRDLRKAWGEERHKMVMEGALLLPQGIGLSGIGSKKKIE